CSYSYSSNPYPSTFPPLIAPSPPTTPLFPYTPLFRSNDGNSLSAIAHRLIAPRTRLILFVFIFFYLLLLAGEEQEIEEDEHEEDQPGAGRDQPVRDGRQGIAVVRSEERRVGKEWSGWWGWCNEWRKGGRIGVRGVRVRA